MMAVEIIRGRTGGTDFLEADDPAKGIDNRNREG